MRTENEFPYVRANIASAALVLMATVALSGRATTVEAVFNSASDVPIAADGYTATGQTLHCTLNFAPETGTDLVVVNDTGLGFISGRFDNLVQGQAVILSYGGVSYSFVANYYGGNGNDLVLVWGSRRAYAWGCNDYGQIGDNGTADRLAPAKGISSGLLAGKTVVALAAGGSTDAGHTLALCSDGTVAAWGANSRGQLGDGSFQQRLLPVAVDMTSTNSALYGKMVVGVAAGWYHSLAVCSDGMVAAWGDDSYGALGNNAIYQFFSFPVTVSTNAGVSALYGKTVVAVAAGDSHSLALCSDGTVAAWGDNYYGQLGDNTTIRRLVPVAVNTNAGASALYGKRVVAIAAGWFHSLALCSDGTVAAWGQNWFGQLGDNTLTQRSAPVAVNRSAGVSVLSNKTVVAVGAGGAHSLALCSDGTVAAWGDNGFGELGDGSGVQHRAPVSVSTDPGVSVLCGKLVVSIAAGATHNLALCSDRTVAGWGYNASGQVGNNGTNNCNVPVAVNCTALEPNQRFTFLASGDTADHTLGLVAGPPAGAATLAGANRQDDGSFQFGFTNTPGAFCRVVATTDPGMPADNWVALDDAREDSPGQFRFTDPSATNSLQWFYRVRWP